MTNEKIHHGPNHQTDGKQGVSEPALNRPVGVSQKDGYISLLGGGRRKVVKRDNY